MRSALSPFHWPWTPGVFRHRKSGFTLIELLIYVAITAIVVVAMTYVMIAILGARSHSSGEGELHYGMRYSMDRMVRSILNARMVDSKASVMNNDDGKLVLISGILKPSLTTFSLSHGRVFLRSGTGSAVPLTPPTITVKKLRLSIVPFGGVKIMMTGFQSSGTGVSVPFTLQTSAFSRQ